MSDSGRVDILLVEDNEGDILLAQEAFEDAKMLNTLNVMNDGEKALDFLFKRNGYEGATSPSLVFLDLNMPKVSGRDILDAMKSDDTLSQIPVVVLTSSKADQDVLKSHDLNANAYVIKPIMPETFIEVVQKITSLGIEIVSLPANGGNS